MRSFVRPVCFLLIFVFYIDDEYIRFSFIACNMEYNWFIKVMNSQVGLSQKLNLLPIESFHACNRKK